MKNSKFKTQNSNFFNYKRFFSFLILLIAGCWLPLAADAQRLDNVTADEDVLIREADQMDARMDVYVHIVDRRFLALNDPNAEQSKPAQKDFEKYGKLRTGAPAKLQADIARTLAEAISRIDDAADRDQKNPIFAKSVRILSKACERWLPQLKTSLDRATDETEKSAVDNSIDQCNDVIAASSKVPKETLKDDGKKKSPRNSN